MKYRYITVDENYRLYGTNDLNILNKYKEFQMCYDLETGERIDVPNQESIIELKDFDPEAANDMDTDIGEYAE